MSFRLVLVFISCISVVCLAGKKISGSGPYKIIPLQVTPCKNPKLPLAKETLVLVYLTMKKTFMSGNITILKDIAHHQMSLEDFYYDENGTQQLTYQVKRLTCRGQFLGQFAKTFGVKVDMRSCTVQKGVYPFVVDINKFEHLWKSTREYGRMTRRIEIYSKTRTSTCFECHLEVLPAAEEN